MLSINHIIKLWTEYTTSTANLCLQLDQLSCFIKVPVRGNYSHSEVIQQTGLYHLFMLNCQNPTTEVTYNVIQLIH